MAKIPQPGELLQLTAADLTDPAPPPIYTKLIDR
jgi:hypothetical protein